jgi:hypothetical protein
MTDGDARQLFRFALLYGFLPVSQECETHMVRWFRPVYLMQDELGIAA